MKCKYCKAKITADTKKCPKCKKLDPQPPKMTTKRKVTLISCVAGLALLGLVLMMGLLRGWDIGSWFRPRENNIYFRKNYSVSDGKARRRQDQVVATMGDKELTNAVLQAYYWRQVYDFRDSYGDSAAYLGLNFTGNLAKQAYLDGSSSWQQYFLKSALDTWKTNVIFAELAEKNGFELPKEYQDFLDNVEQRLQQTATSSGYSSVEEMVHAELGEGCTVEAYIEYLQVYYRSYLYFRELYDALEPTEEEIEKYFEENKESYASSGITKDDAFYVDMRHIMFYPEGGNMTTSGIPYYTDEAWEICRSEAEMVLAQWEKGERTEDSFAELAKEHSDDATTKSNGGLYSGTASGDLMNEIDKWCFDTSRKPGDYTLIKTDYGYHLIYFVEAEDAWHAEARADLIQVMAKEMVDEMCAGYAMQIEYKKIVLGKVELSY